jgi:hypothetical protein
MGKKPSTKELRPLVLSPQTMKGELKSIGGSKSDDWNNILANQVYRGLWLAHSSEEVADRQKLANVAALASIGPRDELEGMIAAQLLCAHNAAMECYRRAMIGEQTFEGRRDNLLHANKLSRTYAILLETLNRHRGKGHQKVTVEHVHVHSGGQAVVGVVSPGGGERDKIKEQPHAKQLPHALEPEMPGANPAREPVPVAGDDER